jgi:hypothetical protein
VAFDTAFNKIDKKMSKSAFLKAEGSKTVKNFILKIQDKWLSILNLDSAQHNNFKRLKEKNFF